MKQKKYCIACGKEFFDAAVTQCHFCGGPCEEYRRHDRALSELIEEVKRDFENVRLSFDQMNDNPGGDMVPEPDNSPVGPESFSSRDTGFDLAGKLNAEMDPFDAFDRVASEEESVSPQSPDAGKDSVGAVRGEATTDKAGRGQTGKPSPGGNSIKKALDVKTAGSGKQNVHVDTGEQKALPPDSDTSEGNSAAPPEKYQDSVPEPSDSGHGMNGVRPQSLFADSLKPPPEKGFRQWYGMKRCALPVLIFVILAAGYLVITRVEPESPQAESTDSPALFEADNKEEGIPSETENIPDPGQKKESNAGDSPEAVADTTHTPAGPGSADVSTAENKPFSPPQQSPAVTDVSYFVHAYSYRNEEDAARQAEGLRQLDFPVQVQSVDVTDSGIWYRVLFGPFSTRTKARSVQKIFVAATGVQDSRIIRK